MSKRSSIRRLRAEAGFTVVEMLIYAVISVVVISAGYQLLFGQQRLYLKQRELQDVRATLRAAGNLLAYEFRSATAFGGDVSSISPDSFVIRSITGVGTVCAEHGSQPRLGVYGTTGDITAGDSVVVHNDGNSWVVASIDQIWDPAAAGVPDCDWSGVSEVPVMVLDISLGAGYTPPDAASGEILIEPQGTVDRGNTVTFKARHPLLSCSDFDGRAAIDIDGSSSTMSGCSFSVAIKNNATEVVIAITLDAVDYSELSYNISGGSSWLDLASGVSTNVADYTAVGAPFRAFDRVQYGIFQEDGRWWLGRKVGAAASYEMVTGPLRPPSDNGLVFTYYSDSNGTTTTDPEKVKMVDIQLRGESLGVVRRAGGQAPAAQQDELTIRVSLRG